MKLSNKKTGEIWKNAKIVTYPCGDKDSISVCQNALYGQGRTYDSLAELNEEWEDYKPTEPLIKKESVRKLVSDWAKLTQTTKILTVNRRTSRGGKITEFFSQERFVSLEISGRFDVVDMKEYTITELCGEGEE